MTTYIPVHNRLDGDDPLAAALCRDDPRLFDGPASGWREATVDEAFRFEAAKKVCARCPVFAECAAIRDIHLSRRTRIEGVWAGQVVGVKKLPSMVFPCGHSADQPNTIRVSGYRRCRTCKEKAQREFKCGHPRSPENTVYRDGGKYTACKQCRREANRLSKQRWLARKREAAGA